MNREDVIRMARESEIIDFRDASDDRHVAQMVEFLQRFAALVAAAEREACASIVAEMRNKSRNHLFRSALAIAAGEIRARGEPPVQACCVGGPNWGHVWDCKKLP